MVCLPEMNRVVRVSGALGLALGLLVGLGGGCGSEQDPNCVGVSCAPRICGTACSAHCGCCDCADGDKLVQGGSSYLCHGGCFELVAGDGGSDATLD